MTLIQRLRRWRPTRRQAVLTGIGVLIVFSIAMMMRPGAVPVQTAAVATAPVQVIIEDEGETRVVNRYVVSAPVMAHAQRITLKVGDIVEAGQPLVRLEPPRAAILDPRAQSEAAARVTAARASLRRTEIEAQQAVHEMERFKRLLDEGVATQQAVERATVDAARATAALDAARAELAAAEAAQRAAAGSTAQPVDAIRAPTSGRVLAVHNESGGPVSPGQPLLEIGDTRQLQVQSDVLSQDAVRIAPGTRVRLEQWGGAVPLDAVVTHVDPQGFTRVSALGVEERRVRVLANITTPADEYTGLGAGYRVLARFIVWESPAALQVPTAALFRHGDGWAVFVVENGVARLRPVEIGMQAGLATQVLSGLTDGEVVIVHPGNDLEDGARVSGGS
jgi:HlyD family secretion protein